MTFGFVTKINKAIPAIKSSRSQVSVYIIKGYIIS